MNIGGEHLTAGIVGFAAIGICLSIFFEFINGFHDTANAVATVIYTHSLPPTVAVIWSGIWNFIGVLLSTGAVAYSVVAILPPSLVLNVSSGTGAAALFALLLGAVIWNFGTWYFGIPCSSSHSLIGSMLGVSLVYTFAQAKETLKKLAKEKRIGAKDLDALQAGLKKAVEYIPIWVKATVALALGLGTMIGWRRIVIRKTGLWQTLYYLVTTAKRAAISFSS